MKRPLIAKTEISVTCPARSEISETEPARLPGSYEEALDRKNRDLGNGPSPERDLGNRASPVDRAHTVGKKVKSAFGPSGPSGRSLSRFHEATGSISTPPWMGC